MSGVGIVAQLLRAHAPLVEMVPAASIKDGPIQLGSGLPAIAVEQISSTDFRLLCPEDSDLMTDRVQVTVAANGTRERRQIVKLVRDACRGKRGTLFGVAGADVQSDGQGPDFMDEGATIYLRTQDFRVAYREGDA